MTELLELNLAFQRLLSDDPEAEEQAKMDMDDEELDEDEDMDDEADEEADEEGDDAMEE